VNQQRERAGVRLAVVLNAPLKLRVVALVMVGWQCARLLPLGATTAQDKTITVFAAASLTNALDDVHTAFTKQSSIKIVVSYGASSALAKQIEQGVASGRIRLR
jgi:ABC-type molybdate transport system substrate-binding protein